MSKRARSSESEEEQADKRPRGNDYRSDRSKEKGQEDQDYYGEGGDSPNAERPSINEMLSVIKDYEDKTRKTFTKPFDESNDLNPENKALLHLTRLLEGPDVCTAIWKDDKGNITASNNNANSGTFDAVIPILQAYVVNISSIEQIYANILADNNVKTAITTITKCQEALDNPQRDTQFDYQGVKTQNEQWLSQYLGQYRIGYQGSLEETLGQYRNSWAEHYKQEAKAQIWSSILEGAYSYHRDVISTGLENEVGGALKSDELSDVYERRLQMLLESIQSYEPKNNNSLGQYVENLNELFYIEPTTEVEKQLTQTLKDKYSAIITDIDAVINSISNNNNAPDFSSALSKGTISFHEGQEGVHAEIQLLL